jgi:hypothetical protein
MIEDFNTLFYTHILPNISDYVIEFGKAYHGGNMMEAWNSISIVKQAETTATKHKLGNPDKQDTHNTFMNKLKFIYKRDSKNNIEYVVVGSDTLNPELINPRIFEELISTIEDKTGVLLFDYINK